MNAETEEFLLSLRERLAVAMNAIGNETVSLTQESISEWCPEFHAGNGGHSPIGGPPYLETGALFDGISHDVSEAGESTVLTVRSRRQGPAAWAYAFRESGRGGSSPNTGEWNLDLDVPQWLEEETEGNRPYMRPQLDRLEQTFLDDLAARLTTDSTEPAPF